MMSVNLAFIDLNEQDQVCEFYNEYMNGIWLLLIILGLVSC